MKEGEVLLIIVDVKGASVTDPHCASLFIGIAIACSSIILSCIVYFKKLLSFIFICEIIFANLRNLKS